MVHIPVLLEETIAALDPKPDENFVDGTFGWGGHSAELLKRNAPHGLVLGLELDKLSLEDFKTKNPKLAGDSRLILENASYTQIADAAKRHDLLGKINGILLDLGMSSWHVDESKKGFSFSKDEPLDMRYCQEDQLTAFQIVNNYSAVEIEKILEEYGQEKLARRISKGIEAARKIKPIESTKQLVAVIEKSMPPYPPKLKTRILATVFQSLRIAVNRELENVERGIDQGFGILCTGGRMVAISFHSLEDRVVKNKFSEFVKTGKASYVIEKPVGPSEREIEENPRSRSAKIRAVVKL